MQPGFFVIILVLQSERLMRILVNPLVLFQTAPGGVLFAVFGVVKDLRQRFVAVLVGVEIGVAAFVGVLLK